MDTWWGTTGTTVTIGNQGNRPIHNSYMKKQPLYSTPTIERTFTQGFPHRRVPGCSPLLSWPNSFLPVPLECIKMRSYFWFPLPSRQLWGNTEACHQKVQELANKSHLELNVSLKLVKFIISSLSSSFFTWRASSRSYWKQGCDVTTSTTLPSFKWQMFS